MATKKFKDLSFDDKGLPIIPTETAMFLVFGGETNTMLQDEADLKDEQEQAAKTKKLDNWTKGLGILDTVSDLAAFIPGVGPIVSAAGNAVAGIGKGIVQSQYETGGFLEGLEYSGSNGFIVVKGPKHNQMTDQGIVPGVDYTKDSSSQPTFVEGGEAIWDEFVFTNSRVVPDDIAKQLKVTKGSTWAEAAIKLNKEYAERPNNPNIKKGRDEMLNRLREFHLQYVPESRPENMALSGVNNLVQGATFGKYGGYAKYLWNGGNPGDPPFEEQIKKQPTIPMVGSLPNNVIPGGGTSSTDPIIDGENISGIIGGGIIPAAPQNQIPGGGSSSGSLGHDNNHSNPPTPQPSTPNQQIPGFKQPTVPAIIGGPSVIGGHDNDGHSSPSGSGNTPPGINQGPKQGVFQPSSGMDNPPSPVIPPDPGSPDSTSDSKSNYYDQLRYAPIIQSGADALTALFTSPQHIKASDYTIKNQDKAEEMNIQPILSQIDRGQRTVTKSAIEQISNPALLASILTGAGSRTSQARGEAVMNKQEFDIAERNRFADTERAVDQYNSQVKLGVKDRNDANRAAWLAEVSDSAANFAQNIGNFGREEKLGKMASDVFGYDSKTGKFTGSPMLNASEFMTIMTQIMTNYPGLFGGSVNQQGKKDGN